MPHIKKVNSLQESCLKSIAFNIDKWRTFQNVETAGDQKVEHLDVKGPLDALREYCLNYGCKFAY